MPFIAALWPRRAVAQVVLILLVAMVSVLLLVVGAFHFMREEDTARPDVVARGLQGVAAASRLNRVEPGLRPALLAELNLEMPQLRMEPEAAGPSTSRRDPGRSFPPPFWPREAVDLGEGMSMTSAADFEAGSSPPGDKHLSFALADGSRYRLVFSEMPPPPVLGNPLFLGLCTLAVSSVLLLIWGTRVLVRPLTRLAQAVADFGQETADAIPVAEEGPEEVRQAARAFNRMQRRIVELLERRTQMLTAIGHDLRTPLTRLRLRIDLMPDEDLKHRNLADLSLMNSQLEGALNFLRDGRTGEADRRLDLPSLLQTISDQYADMNRSLEVNCSGGLVLIGRAGELTRALTNLIDNALRYSAHVSLRTSAAEGKVIIDVTDHGPGIAPGDRERLLAPFERADTARNLGRNMADSGHLGLGLATAQAIAKAHGGDLQLLETPGGGLTARLTLSG
ncbi:ATP-binding protein [Roseibium sp.]|uniref:ATP-binding protein n=1 Tax=Roseibium sp. TaxID=1936156 RepID=UPI003A978B9C